MPPRAGATAVLPPGAAPVLRPGTAPIVVAFSGGNDSTALLDLVRRARDRKLPGFERPLAVHVHHGLQPAADAWAERAARWCESLAIPLVVCRVQVQAARRTAAPAAGIEGGARAARYAALAREARAAGAALVLTAHHLDDRLETFLLQWLRGASLQGLVGPHAARPLRDAEAADAAGEGTARADAPWLVRPFLAVPRAELQAYRERHRLPAVDDPSNLAGDRARGVLRTRVLPAFASLRAGYRASAARSLDLLEEAAAVLDELAAGDLATCVSDAPVGMLRLDRLGQLGAARQALVLRRWLAQGGVALPSEERLRELLAQAGRARPDARVAVRIGPVEVRRHRGLLLMRPAAAATPRAELKICWAGEGELGVPHWGGVLRFEPTADEGFDAAWLRERPLALRARTGGEKLKPHAVRPSRTLKHLFQEAGVPEFERAGLPLVWRDDELIFVAGLGADVRYTDRGGDRRVLRWVPDRPLIAVPAMPAIAGGAPPPAQPARARRSPGGRVTRSKPA